MIFVSLPEMLVELQLFCLIVLPSAEYHYAHDRIVDGTKVVLLEKRIKPRGSSFSEVKVD